MCLYANLLRSIELDPLSFGWIEKDSLLFPNKSLRYFPEWMYVSYKSKSCLHRCSCRSSDLPCTEYRKCGEACLNNVENEFQLNSSRFRIFKDNWVLFNLFKLLSFYYKNYPKNYARCPVQYFLLKLYVHQMLFSSKNIYSMASAVA